MIISLIAALGSNRVIGDANTLPWHLPEDFKHFKELTLGHAIIMGRKTYDSIGKPLPKRLNIVVTRQNLVIPGCEVADSLESALKFVENEQEVFIIGGAQIFAQALPIAHRMYLTLIEKEFPGDAYFPLYNEREWKEIERKKIDNPFPYSFVTLERITS